MKRLVVLAVMLLMTLANVAGAGTVTYIYSDPQGTPLAEANSSGAITATFDYKPYGTQVLGLAEDGPGYTGHVKDVSTGLVYMQARYYDPVIGRFLSIDPKEVIAGNTEKFSRYSYANNNPTTNFDPDGKDTEVAMSFHITEFGLGLGYHHEFVTIRDTASNQIFVLRAGPSGDYPLSNGLSNSTADRKGFLPLFGQEPMTLQASSGPLEKSAEAGFNNKTLAGSQVTLKQPLDDVLKSATKIATAVNNANIPYRPESTNSNAFANTAYKELTGKTPPQQDVAEGAETKLPVALH